MTWTRRVILLVACLLPFIAVLGHAWAAPGQPVIPGTYGQAALEALGADVPAVAGEHGISAEKLAERLNLDEHLGVDSNRRLFYSEATLAELAPYSPEATSVPTDAVGGLAPLDDTFLLHSRPGSPRVIYLDFDGHVLSGTAWNVLYNSGLDIVCPPWDCDGGSSVFSELERTRIQQIWQRVAEDYAPFDVDVTTEYPGEDAITRSGETDAYYGMRVLISPISSHFGSYGGMSYVAVFDAVGDFYKPALVFPERLANGEKYIGEACSHESGHTLGLYHDGLVEALGGDEYYSGHGTGETGWAPIMGNGYYRNLTQWSKGEYKGANNAEDDVAIISSNGLPFLADDHGNSPAEAAPLPESDSPSLFGCIGGMGDADLFSFAAGTGQVDVQISVVSPGPDLDVLVELRDESGVLLASSNPLDQLPAALSAPVSAGTHYLRVTGTGRGTPLTGYSDYGSLGSYTLTASLPSASPTFILTPSAGPGGGIAPSLPQTVSEGQSVTFAMVPDPGYHVADVLVDGDSVGAVTSYDFTNVSNDHTIDVRFAEDRPPTTTVVAPTGQAGHTSSDTFTAAWTSDQPLSTGQFAVWVRSPADNWYVADLVPVDGGTVYSASVSLTGVTPGLGYQVIVAYESIVGTGLWTSWATSPGVFSVDAVAPTVTITQPAGIHSYTSDDTLVATLTTSTSVSDGEFGVWVRSAAGVWYATTLVAANSTANYTTDLSLSGLPAALGYEVIVAYRPVAGSGAFMSWATSPGNFSVDLAAPVLTINDPIGGTYPRGSDRTVSWTTSPPLSAGEFGVWFFNGTSWYHSQLAPATGAGSYDATVTLSLPTGSGYQVVVAYRPNVGIGAFVSWATSPGDFSVTP